MLTQEEINGVKARGFLRNRGTDCFSGRVVAPGTVFTAPHFAALAEMAERFGNGKLIATSRQCIEIPGIPFDRIPEAEAFAAAHDLHFGGTGAKVRPVTACKGTTCTFGCCDTHAIATRIHKAYYEGWSNVKLPHKFKISVGGCPNSCMKPGLNDFGVEARRKNGESVFTVFVGGTWGRTTRMGTPLSRQVTEEELLPLLEKSMLWFRENGFVKERFGKTIDRVGFDRLEAALFSDELLARKEEILAAALKENVQ